MGDSPNNPHVYCIQGVLESHSSREAPRYRIRTLDPPEQTIRGLPGESGDSFAPIAVSGGRGPLCLPGGSRYDYKRIANANDPVTEIRRSEENLMTHM